jgi:hypothetical protein
MQRIHVGQFGPHKFVTEKTKTGVIQPGRMTVRTQRSVSGSEFGASRGGGEVQRITIGVVGTKAIEFGAVMN